LGYLSPEEYEQKFVQEREKKLGKILDNKKAKGALAKSLSCRTF
jgi:hypothetical protein